MNREENLQNVVLLDFVFFQRFHVSRLPRMSFCCTQQNAPNQRLPQTDLGAQSNGGVVPTVHEKIGPGP